MSSEHLDLESHGNHHPLLLMAPMGIRSFERKSSKELKEAFASS